VLEQSGRTGVLEGAAAVLHHDEVDTTSGVDTLVCSWSGPDGSLSGVSPPANRFLCSVRPRVDPEVEQRT